MAVRLFVVRHGESEWNAQRRWQGHADPPLTARGRLEAKAAAAALDGSVARVASSDLRRARETAAIFSTALGLPGVVVDPQLREIDVGEWSGLTRDEIEERWPGAIERWRAGEPAAPGAEDRAVFRERILGALRAVALADSSPALVVTHAAALGTIERHLGVHPGTGVGRLVGRWLEWHDDLRAVGDRVSLLDRAG